MEVATKAAVDAVLQLQVVAEVGRTTERLAAEVEIAHYAGLVRKMDGAIRLCRSQLEAVQRERHAEMQERLQLASEAAALQEAFNREVEQIRAELSSKFAIESELADVSTKLGAEEKKCTELTIELDRVRDLLDKERHNIAAMEVERNARRLQGVQLFFSLNSSTTVHLFSYLSPVDLAALSATNGAMYCRVSAFLTRLGIKKRLVAAPNGAVLASVAVAAAAAPINPTLTMSPSMPSRMPEASPKKLEASPPPTRRAAILGRPKETDPAKQVKALEAQLSDVIAEKEDLTAALRGAEDVKDMLKTRLKELTAAVRDAEEQKAQAMAQAASDKQVMAFLDERLHELEEQLQAVQRERDSAAQQVSTVAADQSLRIKMLEDMLRSAAAEKEDMEAKFKVEKKALIKEVRALRAAATKPVDGLPPGSM